MRHLNQAGLLPQETMDNWAIGIIGTGAIGSFTVMALAKMGFKNIVTWDNDKIEDHNIANQMFPVEDVGIHKALATRKMVKQFSGEDIITLSTVATGAKVIKFMRSAFAEKSVLIILCVDSLDTRKALAEALVEEYGIFVIDARMGAKTYRVLGFDTKSVSSYQNYMKSLVPDSEAVQEPCGQKSIIYTVLGVAAEVCSFVHKAVSVNPHTGRCMMPEPVVFDYGSGMRIQHRIVGEVEVLDEMPDALESLSLTANSVVLGQEIPVVHPF